MKRFFDFLIALFLIIVLSPFIIVIAVSVFFVLGSPVVFTQIRPGLNEKVFRMYKFRSMKELYDSKGVPLSDKERLTAFGRFLRSTSLDELPGLFNVVKGDMSLVGPRPLLVEYLPLYNEFQSKRHNVRPGITGWAQINGRNALSWEQKFELDVWYVDNRTFLLDLKILFLTVKKVFIREGISAAGDVTMPVFKGNLDNEK